MKLEKFRVTNYRSIKDSGWIETGHRTVLVGRNESGKTNLLMALRTLKSAEKLEPLTLTRDFPADESTSKLSEDDSVVRSFWQLGPDEKEELARLFPRARNVERVEIGRGYETETWVRFDGLLSEPSVPVEGARSKPALLVPYAGGSDPEDQVGERDNDTSMLPSADIGSDASEPSDAAAELLAKLASPPSSANTADATEDLEGVDTEKAARDWVLRRLPTFIYLDDYPEIDGHQNLVKFLQRQTENRPEPGDEYFEKLLVAAELDPKRIDLLLTADPDTRRQLVNRAGGVITTKLRQLWSDRPLKVRFDLDGEHFHTLISDPNSVYDVEINLSSRSRGFRWFFSFYVSFAADAKSGSSSNSIVLLDEPGLHLHPLGQRDLLDHLNDDFTSQVLLTTQSPFMVPADAIDEVRSVSISEQRGTTVSAEPVGDEKTLFPMAHALGAELTKRLLGDQFGLVVEEVSDLWYLRGVSNFVRERGGPGLPSALSIFPAGGSAHVMYMTALLTAESGKSIILRSDHPAPEMMEGVEALNAPDNVVFLGTPTPEQPMAGGDVEDLLDPRIYDQLVRNAYKTQLEGRTLEPNEEEPRVVKRYKDAVEAAGLVFSRERVARVFLRAMSQSPDAVMPDASRERFERLFGLVRGKFEKLV